MPLLGTDIYSGNADAKVTAAIAREDFVFHLFKASEGRTHRDVDYLRNCQWAEEAGDTSGAYHFAWMNNPGVDEARWFLDCAQPRAGQLLAGDWEDWGPKDPATGERIYMRGISWAQRWQHALDWTATVIDETATRPLCYVNWNYLKNFRLAATVADWEWWIQNPLWLAQWQTGGVQTKPGQFDYAAPHRFGTVEWHPTFHQYISGSTSPSGVDEDWFVGSRVDLSRYVVQSDEEFDMSAEQFQQIMAEFGLVKDLLTAVAGAVAGVEVSVEEAETAVVTKVSDVGGTLGLGQASIQSDIAGMGDAVASTVSEAASSAIVETMDATLGGAEISARFVRQRGTAQ